MSKSKAMTAQGVADWFNDSHPIGTSVTYFPGVLEGEAREGQTRSEAWVVGDEPVVAITGYAGGIHLGHVVCARHASHAVSA
jgi:hypothetical protein